MEIRDVIHGSIQIEPLELPIIDSRYFQRLRQIKQLGFGENSFPSATHNRYIHSLGAMQTASRVFESIFNVEGNQDSFILPSEVYRKLRTTIRLAALLHDIGHGPLSHTSEIAMPDVKTLQLPFPCLQGRGRTRKATHEDYTLKLILDSGLTPVLETAGLEFGLKPAHIAALIDPKIDLKDSFFVNKTRSSSQEGDQLIDFRPILKQIISSELDADRMDYLRRDSVFTGVSYGHFDFDWLVRNLTFHLAERKCYLCLQHRALYTFEDFLLSRFHMFLMVYFHHKSVIFDEMLKQYFSSKDCDYFIPSDIEEYCLYNDTHLLAHLSQSSNTWAKRIVEQKPYKMLIELHSGIPATKSAHVEQQRLLEQIQQELSQKHIHYLAITSTSELSKYFRGPGDPIFVRYDNHFNWPTFIALEDCTDLFQKYSEKRTIHRLYISPEIYSEYQNRAKPNAI